jgi:predicted outer membrane repeat protein
MAAGILTMPVHVAAGQECRPNPVVSTLADSGRGSLREAVLLACSGSTITFTVTGRIQYSLDGLEISGNLTIQGPGVDQLTLAKSSGSAPTIIVRTVTATISGLTLADGAAGAILNEGGTLTIDRVAFVNNHGILGAAVRNSIGPTSGPMTILNSTFSNNVASESGGAVYHGNPGGLTVVNCTFSNNRASNFGGAIYITKPNATIINSTITGNRANASGALNSGTEGGGIFTFFQPTTLLLNTIVAGNYTGGASPAADDVDGSVSGSSASNLIGVATQLSGTSNGSNGNQIGTPASPFDPRLGPLADNGGPTQTHALLAGSPALDAGDNSLITAYPTDQRGFPRLIDGPDAGTVRTVDIGAVEQDPSIDDIPNQIAAEDTALPVSFGVGEGTTDCSALTVTSSNTAVVANDAAHLQLAGGSPACTLTVVPQPGVLGTTTITVTVPASAGGPPVTTSDQFEVDVEPVGHTPTAAGTTTFVNTPTAPIAIALNPADGPEIPWFKFSGIANGTLALASGGPALSDPGYLTVAAVVSGGGVIFTPASGSTATGQFTVQATRDNSGNGASPGRTVTIGVGKHSTLTHLSAAPDPSARLAPVTATFQIDSLDGGPAPTGSVQVTIDGSGGETCTGSISGATDSGVAVGTCTLPGLAAPGVNRLITATYLGDTFSDTSSGTTPHTVLTCPIVQVVTSTNDSGPGSLRQALADACATDTINFAIPGTGPDTITLASPLSITKQISLVGPTDRSVRISGGHTTTIAEVDFGATLTIVNLTLMDGAGPAAGAIHAFGDVTIKNSTLSGNFSCCDGSAIAQVGGDLTIYDSTVSGNSSPEGGATIKTSGVTLLVATTVTANTDTRAVEYSNHIVIENSIIAGNGLEDLFNAGGTLAEISNLIGGDPKLGPLQDNGGPTLTHAPLANSPAIDGGNTDEALFYATSFDVTTDQRGVPRVLAGPGTTTPAVDLGAVEARASLLVSDFSTAEDVPVSGELRAGDPSLITSVTMTSGSPALVPNDPAHISLTNTGPGVWSYSVTPAADKSGVVTLTVTVNTPDEILQALVRLIVVPTADTPSVTSATTAEDTQTTTGLVLSINAADSFEVSHFKITGMTGGTLFQNDGVTPISDGQFITVGEGHASLKFTPAANFHGTASFHVQASVGFVDAGLGGGVATATITVTPVPDLPVAQNYTTPEDTPFTDIVIQRHADDGSEVTHFQITGITGGTMTRSDGTPILDGALIAAVQPGGLIFIPAPNSLAAGHFTVRGAVAGAPPTLGPAATVTITITPVADTPSITPASTRAQIQTTSGLVISANPIDGAEVTHFHIVAVVQGTLYQHDGTTPIPADTYITVAQGNAGLRFTPADGLAGTASVTVEATTSAGPTGASPGVTGSITVNRHDTATAITSDDPDQSDQFSQVTVTYAVTSTTGGPTPAGPVTITMGGGPETCTGSVAGGQCTLTLDTAGAGRTITATYNGDAVSSPSSGTALHDVRGCPVNPVVTTTGDSGAGSLRQALADACSQDLIQFALPGPGPHTITLTSGPLATNKSLTIRGPLDSSLRISGNHASRVFDFTGPQAALLALTIMDGAADAGAGVRTAGSLFMEAVTLSGNAATVSGGAVFGDGSASQLEVYLSTLSGNSAPDGSAIRADGTVVIANATVTANTGDGAAVLNAGVAAVLDAIITGNDGVSVANAGTLLDLGGNLFTGDPKLGPLQDNGGPTLTHMPLPGSPAIGGGDPTTPPPIDVIDQRGFPRFSGRQASPFPAIDSGAVEVVPTVDAIAAMTTPADTAIAVPFAVGDTVVDPFVVGPPSTPPFESIVATSSDQSVVPDANLVITGSGESRTLTITPSGTHAGTATITIAATAKIVNVFVNFLVSTPIPVTTTSSFLLTVTPLASSTTVTTSGSPSNQGQGVTFTATISPAGSGTVQFTDGAAALGSPVFVAGGVATLTTSSLAPGLRTISAVYGGDAARLPSTGTLAGGQFVRAAVALTVSSSPNPSLPGHAVTIQATALSTPGGAPTGSIVFKDGATTLATVALASGSAAYTTSALRPGTHHLVIEYSGDATSAPASTLHDHVVMGTRSILAGPDVGASPEARRFMALDGGVPPIGALSSFPAFEASFTGGVRVAEGDVNGDGVPDYIAGAGPGGAPDVRVYDGATGAVVANLLAFESDFRGGVFVAAGDVNGDGYVDVIAASGEGRAGEVKVFSGRDLSVIGDTPVFDPAFTGGVRVAAGDVNGDGFADLVVGTGAGAATVTVLSGADRSVLRTFTAYAGFAGGIYVAAGDVTGDGYADIVTGPAAGGGPHVKVFDGRTGANTHGFFAFDPAFTGGVRVAAGDVNGDGHADLIAAAGPGGAPEVRVFDPVTTTLLNAVLAYAPGFTGGVFVATAVPVSRMAIDAPVNGATVRSTLTLSGWAFEEGGRGAGIAGIDVTALPVGGGAAIPLGTATLGGARPDVAALYGAQYANAGFQLSVSGLAPGVYDLRVTARSAVSGAANLVRVVRITVAPDPQPILAIDIPAAGRLSSGDFVVAGWALTPETDPAPGVDAIHVWAAPVGGGAWKFLGSAVLGLPRADVAIVFGSQYATAGYYLNVTGLAPGTWDLLVFPRATGRAAFAAPQIVRVTVPGGSTRSIMTGADAGGGPHVKRFDPLDGGPPAVGALSSFFAFDGSFTGGVRVAEGDVTGDGVPDYIAAMGPGAAPEIRIIDGASGTIRASIVAFEPDFRGGVFVAAADVNGDGLVDVIAGSGEGRRGEIKVFSGRDASLIRDVFVFDAAFRGGVHVAAGDVNGDGYADLVVGAGAGGTEVLVLNATDLSTLWTVTPYAGFLGGVWVAAGDVTGDGFADVITGAGAGGGPHVRVYDGRTGVEARNFFAYEGEFAGGVRVAVGDVTGDGTAEIITGPGPGRASDVRVFDAATAALLSNVLAYPGFTAGVFVATAVPVNRMALDTPADGAIVHGPFSIAGWAFDEHPSTAGLDAIHVWAFPVAGGVPTFGGAATLGIPRPDVAALYGAQYATSGFSVDVAGLAPGVYDVVVFGHSSVSGTFNLQRVVRVVVAP